MATRGAPRYVPKPGERELVREWSGHGVPQAMIATRIGVAVNTLIARFGEEMKMGEAEAAATMAKTLFQMATVDRNVAAAIFWMKTRLKWREVVRQENVGVDENTPILHAVEYRWMPPEADKK